MTSDAPEEKRGKRGGGKKKKKGGKGDSLFFNSPISPPAPLMTTRFASVITIPKGRKKEEKGGRKEKTVPHSIYVSYPAAKFVPHNPRTDRLQSKGRKEVKKKKKKKRKHLSAHFLPLFFIIKPLAPALRAARLGGKGREKKGKKKKKGQSYSCLNPFGRP